MVKIGCLVRHMQGRHITNWPIDVEQLANEENVKR